MKFILTFLFLSCCFILKSQDLLTLKQAIDSALSNNYSIKLAKNDNQIATNNLAIAKGNYLPELGINATKSITINNTHQQYFNGNVRDASNAKSNSLNSALQLNWTLFDGFGMFIDSKKWSEYNQASILKLQSVVENSITDIIINYYQIVQLTKFKQVVQEAFLFSKKRYQLSLLRYKLGELNYLGYMQSMVDFNMDSMSLITHNNELVNAKIQLNLLLSRKPEIDFKTEDSIPKIEFINYAETLALIENQNTDLLLAKQNSSIARLNYKLAYSPVFPKINLNTGYNYVKSHSQVGILEENRNLGPTAALSLNYPLFSGFTNNVNRKNAKILVNSSDLVYSKIKLELSARLYQLCNELQTNLSLIEIEKMNVENCKNSTRIAFENYKLGEISDVDLRMVQIKQIEAETLLITAQFKAKQIETEIKRITGKFNY